MTRIDAHALACLDALVTERHVTRAAHRMGIGQPSMSEMLGRLRILFDDPLLVRSARGMIPTPRAVEAASKARDALRLIDEVVSPNNTDGTIQARRPLRIVAVNSLAFSLLPPLIGKLQSATGGPPISIAPADIRLTRELLEGDECDLVFGYPPLISGSLHVSTLYKYKLCCIARLDHPDIRASLSLDQFLKYPHVALGAGALPVSTIESTIDKALRQKRLRRTVGIRVSDLLISPAIVAECDYIAVVPEPVARRFQKSLKLAVFDMPIAIAEPRVMMIWHERTHRDPYHRLIRREARILGNMQVSQAS